MNIQTLFNTGSLNRATQRKPKQLMDIAKQAEKIIDRAKTAGVVIDDGNVIDLLADNIQDVSLFDLRCALVCTKFRADLHLVTVAHDILADQLRSNRAQEESTGDSHGG